MIHHHHRATSCPRCDRVLDASFDPSDDQRLPSPGDWSVCAYCAAILIFTAELQLREATVADLEAEDADVIEQVCRMEAAVRQRMAARRN